MRRRRGEAHAASQVAHLEVGSGRLVHGARQRGLQACSLNRLQILAAPAKGLAFTHLPGQANQLAHSSAHTRTHAPLVARHAPCFEPETGFALYYATVSPQPHPYAHAPQHPPENRCSTSMPSSR